MNSRKCEFFNNDVHGASCVKHLRSKKHLEIEKHKEMIIQNGYFKNLLKIKIKKYIFLNH